MEKKSIDKSQRLLVTQQEMVLIKNSNEATNMELYGNLFDCIQNYVKLSKVELDNNIVFDKKASTPSGQFSNYNRIQLGQLSSCVLCLKLPLDFYTLCITLNRPYPNLLPEAF